MPEDKLSAQERCYAEIVNEATEGLARYYREYEERIDDQRSKDAQEWSMRGVKRILKVLDKYEISEKPIPDCAPAESTEV